MPKAESTSVLARETYTPEVNPHAEFLEICNDFTEPREIVREAISNGFDAGARNIEIAAYVDRTTGRDELVLRFKDDGHGMDATGLKSFFSLAMTTRMVRDEARLQVVGRDRRKGARHEDLLQQPSDRGPVGQGRRPDRGGDGRPAHEAATRNYARCGVLVTKRRPPQRHDGHRPRLQRQRAGRIRPSCAEGLHPLVHEVRLLRASRRTGRV